MPTSIKVCAKIVSVCFVLHVRQSLSRFAEDKGVYGKVMASGPVKRICGIILIILIGMLGACSSGLQGDSASRPTMVTVRRGDTLYAIAKRYDVPLRDLIDANRLTPPYALAVGQKLRLPNPQMYTVVKGDTFYGIGRRYDIPVSALSQLNNIPPPYSIGVGQRLRLTSGESRVASVPLFSPESPPSAPSLSTPVPTPVPPIKPPEGKTATSLSRPFLWPVKGKVIVPYGPIAKGRHNDGINIAVPAETSVLAAEDGTVAYAGNELQGFGNLLLIKHDGGWMTAYAHNGRLLVKKGAFVKRGQAIAKSGQTGNVTVPQVHFEVRRGSTPTDPMNYLERLISSVDSDRASG